MIVALKTIDQRFSKQEASSKTGKNVVSLREFSGVPEGTKGKVLGADKMGRHPEEWDAKIQWDLPGRFKPLVDWFTKGEYERYLKEV